MTERGCADVPMHRYTDAPILDLLSLVFAFALTVLLAAAVPPTAGIV